VAQTEGLKNMRYISTRGQAPALNFEDVLLAGLASDGGLYVPENLPRFTVEEIASWAGLPYHELAFRVMRPFVAGSMSDAEFKKILEETYGVFAHSAVAPLRQLDANEWVLELFHGPTLAFKDFALQLLGRLLDHFLIKRGERVVIMGATSGDTGSAAIEGCKAIMVRPTIRSPVTATKLVPLRAPGHPSGPRGIHGTRRESQKPPSRKAVQRAASWRESEAWLTGAPPHGSKPSPPLVGAG